MDPVSLVASSIAFIGAISVTLQSFRAFYDARTDVERLLTDLEETKTMLIDIERALGIGELDFHNQHNRLGGLYRLLVEANRKLAVLNALVSEKLDISRACVGGPHIARLAWFKHRNKIKKIQDSLNQTSHRLTASLVAANLYVNICGGLSKFSIRERRSASKCNIANGKLQARNGSHSFEAEQFHGFESDRHQ